MTNINRKLIILNSNGIKPSGILLNGYDFDKIIVHFGSIVFTRFEKTQPIHLFGLRVYTSKELEIGDFKFCLD